MSISFERHLSANESIGGTRMSAKGMQLVTSTGIASMDQLLGGGLALNSITLLEEDNYCQYSSVMAKCFSAESIDCKHKTVIVSQTISSKKSRFLRELPARSAQRLKQSDSQSDDIRIAWRYKAQPLVADMSWAERQFDFGSHIDEQTLSSADIEFCSHNSCLQWIRSMKPNDKNVTRILIDGLGSPLSPLPIESLPKFMNELKSLVRQLPNILCLITFSAQLVLASNHSYVRSRVHNIVDSCLQLVVFDESCSTPYTEFDGLLNVIKLSKLHSFNTYTTPETLDFGFQFRNHKRFIVIDKLCLPPDLSETVSRTTGCATGAQNKNLDF